MDGIIETIEALYDPTDDSGNVTAIDMNLLCIIKQLLAKVNELEERIDVLQEHVGTVQETYVRQPRKRIFGE